MNTFHPGGILAMDDLHEKPLWRPVNHANPLAVVLVLSIANHGAESLTVMIARTVMPLNIFPYEFVIPTHPGLTSSLD
jgi:hypothetical protein